MEPLIEAQEKTQDDMWSLIQDGLTHDQAWKLLRKKYLLLPPERDLQR
jgi:hypothetical protein